jgi:cytochrome c nitrite reductase small subunit
MQRRKNILHRLIPPPQWKVAVLLLVGIMVGFIAFLAYISRFHNYLGEDPKTCINCHVMTSQYASWLHSSHRETATCTDCHVPHDNIISKYLFKANDGMRHATIFTLRLEPQVIRIRESAIPVVQKNCTRCHGSLFHGPPASGMAVDIADRLCWDCHREVPHGTVSSLASDRFARVPLPSSPVPDWLKFSKDQNDQNIQK